MMGRGWASLRGRAAAGRTRPPSPDDLEPSMGFGRKGSAAATRLPPGVLQVVIEGADLPAPAALFQAQQLRPCYLVECGGQSTRVCATTVGAAIGGAVWRGAPKFALAGGCAELRITVKDDATGAVLGEAVVDTSRARMNGEDESAAKLKTPRGKTKGMLRFRLRFIPDAPAFSSADEGTVLSSSIGTSSGASGSLPPHGESGSASSYPPSISSSNCGGDDGPSTSTPSPSAPSVGQGFGLRSLFGGGRSAGVQSTATPSPGAASTAPGPTSDDLELHTIAMAAMHELHAQVHEIAGERAADSGASGPLPDSGPPPASRTGSLRKAAARARALLRVARFSGGSSGSGGSASPAAEAQAASRAWLSSDVSSVDDSGVLSQMTAMAEEIEMLHESKAALHKELASLKQAMATLTRQYWAELKSVREAGGNLAARATLPPQCQATLAPLAPLALPAVAATAVVLSPLRPLGRPRDLERRARLSSSSEGSEEERLAFSIAGGSAAGPCSEAALRWYDAPASSRGGPPSVRSIEWFDPERFSVRSGQTPSVRSIEWFDPERVSLPGTLSPPATEWFDSERMSQVSGRTPSEVPPSQYSGRGPSEAPLSVVGA